MLCPRCSAPIKAEDEHCPECNAYLGSSDETVMLMAEDSGGTGVESPGDGNGEATEITETFATKGPVSADDLEIDETIVPAGPGQADDQKVDETLLTTGAKSIPSFGGWSEPGAPPTSGASASGTLEAGRKLGHRYEILRMLGRGGMGAVYKARDVELDRMVALKVIRPELASDPEILQRFKQEIILARDVTHRNIIRIYDLGQAEGIKFLSMEFVEGKDLHAILKEKGPLPVEEAVEIMEQVCFALEEAHETGVVHRDLKPQNIMIGPDGRVVVMDFGIARSVQVTGMTQTGSVLGTPDYMSPEQVKGQQADARSDIFALGVIFFEILTGEKPYKGDSPMATMYKRTQDRAKSVREVNPEVPGFIGDVIARCLEIQPQKRFQSARELVHDLEIWRGGTPGSMAMTMRHLKALPRKSRKKPILIASAILLAIVSIVIGVMVIPRGGSEVPQQVVVAPEEVTSLAILPFTNTSGDESTAWLSSGLTDMLLTDIGQSAYLRTVSPDRMHQILRDLGLSGAEELDAADRRQIAEYANVDKLIWGQYLKLGDQVRIDATVEDIAQQVRTPVKVEASDEGELLESVGELAGLVRESLDLSGDQVAALEDQIQRPSSDSVVAVRHYLQGLELIRQGNNLDAVDEFKKAVAEDPDFALAHSKLATSNLLTGRGEAAEESSSQALALSDDLPAHERNLILAADARIRNDLEQGIEAYEALLRYQPNDPDLHYELGALYEGEGLLDQADDHYAKTLEIDPQNISALLARGRALTFKGEHQSALGTLSRALELAKQLGNREAEANVLHNMGAAYRNLDRQEEAMQKYQQSIEIKRDLDDQRGIAASMSGVAYLQDMSGEFDTARESYQETARLYEALGDQQGVGVTLMNLGDMERMLGNYEESLDLTRRALRIQVEMNDEFNQGLSLNNIGAIYYLQGKYDDALVFYERALEIRKRLEVPGEIADTLHNLGETYQATGFLDRARDHYLQALDIRRNAGDVRGAALESYYIGKVFAAQGRYGAALQSISDSADRLAEDGDRGAWLAETRAWQGHLFSLLAQTEAAEAPLAEALAIAEERQDPWLLSLALNFEGDRLYYGGDYPAAQTALRAAADAANASGDPLSELTTTTNLAKIGVKLGRHREAVDTLDAACTEADRLGLRLLERSCVLHLGIGQLTAGQLVGLETLTDALDADDELTPKDLMALAHYELAKWSLKAGQTEEADRHAEAALSLVDELETESGQESVRRRRDLEGIQDLRPDP